MIQADNSIMTTVLTFHRQMTRHFNFEGKMIPAVSQSECSEKGKWVLEKTKDVLNLVG